MADEQPILNEPEEFVSDDEVESEPEPEPEPEPEIIK